MRLMPLLLMGLVLGDVRSAEPGADAEIERLVGQLGSVEFKLRQQASDELLKRVEKDRKLARKLERYAEHEDPEIRARITELTKDLPPILVWMDPAKHPDLKSSSRSLDSLGLSIMNQSPTELSLYWIDWQGRKQSRGSVKPGTMRYIEKTYVGHVWLLTDAEDKPLGLYVPKEARNSIIHYTAQEQIKAP